MEGEVADDVSAKKVDTDGGLAEGVSADKEMIMAIDGVSPDEEMAM